MKFTAEKIAKIKKTLLMTVVLLVFVSLTILVETQLNKFHIDKPAKVLEVKGDQDDLGVSFSPNADGSDLVKFSTNPDKLPTYFKANDDLTLVAFEGAYITMGQGAELRTLIFTKNKLHLQLINGEVILDNRLSQNPITIQVDNLMLKPYKKGVFYFDKDESTTLQSLQGQSLIGIYDKRGDLKQTTLLPKSTEINYQNQATNNLEPTLNPDEPNLYIVAQNADILPSIEQEIESKELLNLQYKSRNIDPANSSNFLPGLTKKFAFNNKKRHYLKLHAFAEQLKFAEASFLASNLNQGAISITEAKRTFQDQTASSPNSLNTFTDFLQKTYTYYLGLSPNQDLNNIKVYLTDNHLNLFDAQYLKLAILSYFEDMTVYYDKSRTSEAETTLDKISQLIDGANLSQDDSLYMMQVLDNSLAQYPRSNIVQAYILRSTLAEDLDIEKEFEKTSAEHIARLKTYFEDNTIPSNDIQESVAILLNQVSSFDRLQYEDFFDDVSKAAL